MIPDIKKIEAKAISLEASKDSVMQLSRELIRIAGKSIAMMHAQGPKGAKSMLKELSAVRIKLIKAEKGFEYYSMQAHQEFTEAMVLYNILVNGKIPGMESIKESEVPYLLGLMDVVGELKREAIESIRKGNLNDAKLFYSIMSDIYDSTLHMRFASSVLPDFRRKQDSARIQLEGVMNELAHLSHDR